MYKNPGFSSRRTQIVQNQAESKGKAFKMQQEAFADRPKPSFENT